MPASKRKVCAQLAIGMCAVAMGAPACAPPAAMRPAVPDYTIAFASFAPNNSDIFIADSDGSNARPLMPHPAVRYGVPELRVHDIEGDGVDELLVFNYNFAQRPTDVQGGEMRAWKLQGGRYADVSTTVFPNGLRPDHTRAFASGDFNGDGRPDLFVAQHGFDGDPFPGSPNFLLLSRSDGTMANVAPQNMSPYETNSFSHGAASGDVNCDGLTDLFERT